MRILHTADWHLNDRLGRIDRTDDLRKAVERVAVYCREQKVDVLLVAGDLFSELARPDALRETIRHWQDVFADFLAGGGTILALTGNHDNENFCQTLRHAMTLAAPSVGKPGAVVPPGRLYLAADPTLLKLKDRSGADVQFVLMPYPTPTRYLTGEAGQKYSNPDEKNRLLVAAFDRAIQDLRSHPAFDQAAPAVLGAHANVYANLDGPSLFRMSFREDVIVRGERLHEQFAYVALGHIHKPGTPGGHPHVRYCGSIERLDLGEQNDVKGAVVVEIGPGGLHGEPAILPLPATPIYEVSVFDPVADLPRLRAEYPDAKTDLVNLHVSYTAGKDNLEEVLRELEAIFPRWYARDWQESSALGPTLAAGEADHARSVAETVREYLRLELTNHAEEERDALLALADELMADCD